MSAQIVKTRFAPSPTGYLHVGGLRTALFNYLFAKKHNGQFALRVEDTDRARQVLGADGKILEILEKFELVWDEGPIYQSQRLDIYNEHISRLLENGSAYKCYCSKERIEKLKEEARIQKRPFKYDKHCLFHPENTDKSHVIRQNVPAEGGIEFHDGVYGKIAVRAETLDDGILIKSDGYPTYNFANVVDDHLMGVSHVIRGEEFIPSTPKHLLLYRGFGWDLPEFIHLPLILDIHRKKLSKRTGDAAVEDYLQKGYLKEALINFIALLGWNPKTAKELFSLSELVVEFEIGKINKAGAVFDIDKLDFINREWQKRLGFGGRDSEVGDPMFERAREIFKQNVDSFDESMLGLIWSQIRERVKGPSELEERISEFYFYFQGPSYDGALLIWKDTDKANITKNLETLYQFISSDLEQEGETEKIIREKVFALLKEKGIGTGEALWPLRVSLSGLRDSPGPFEIIETFFKKTDGKNIVLSRISRAIEKLREL